jgi:hypothetical protein
MENEGQIEMMLAEPEPQPVEIGVEAQNELLDKFEKAILGHPVFKIGQRVRGSELGIKVEVLKPGEQAIVTRFGADVAKEVVMRGGPQNKNCEVQMFNSLGQLVKRVEDSRFFEGVKS